ncbi:hypothetical protein XAC3810_240060 [Xanthomonas citri pv. citri]|uniref:Uncharacterized protein n=1 Tax=Xanthomonas citri pv. citri TaxID=611301 RepID=A0A0U5FA44_XANCI|nr:hypothetical protein HZS91_01342 [Xanthomonas citri pv. citri]QYF44012.1 hypothetical protein HZS93_01300 [Xanthomonas citri]QYF39238.1 hypothetical protein HZS92_01299 [Xanthomonas citri pv. citri]CEE19870.1 hypothetical protein XAC9322_220059 [Xanthomonas citri pv. citri]CEE19989.1 hypothetical protein XAC3824_220060 [Xanthomonas citri pv. citri]
MVVRHPSLASRQQCVLPLRDAITALPVPWRSSHLPHRVACCSACVTHCSLHPAFFIMQLRDDLQRLRIAVSTQEARPTHVDVRDIAALVDHRMLRRSHAARMLGD